jgi:hypothetical protein
MFSCKSSCRKCFPNGCCGFCKPPPQVQQQVDKKIYLKQAVEEQVTPCGYIEIYPGRENLLTSILFQLSFQIGVRTPDNTYTCPVLAVHLYRHSQYNADIAQDNRTITVDKRNEQQTYQGPKQLKKEEKITAVEDVIMIPVEDVTRIISKSELKKGIQADVKSQMIPVYEESENRCDRCYASLLNCCRKTRDCCCYCCQKETKVAPLVLNQTIIHDADPNKIASCNDVDVAAPKEKEVCCNRFRCWCCRKKKLVKFIKRTNTVAEQKAQRVVTITIEYSKYSNPDSASNARLLSDEQQAGYYKTRFEPDTPLKFYLVNNTEFDPKNFELKRKQADTLCLTVMHLKAMKNRYPSDNELEKMMDQSHMRTFGDVFSEPALELSLESNGKSIGDSQIQKLSQPPQRLAIGQQHTTTSEYHEDVDK